MEKINTSRRLNINSNMRIILIKIMKAKRRLAWIAYILSFFLVIAPFIFFTLHWPGGNVMFYLLPVSVVFLLVSVTTLNGTMSIERALLMNNQSAFDEAMSKWNRRCLLSLGGYLFLIIAIIYSVITLCFVA